MALDDLPDGTEAVVSLCLTGQAQVPDHVEHITFRLMDEPAPAANVNLDYVLLDAAESVARLREEGKRVVVHCVSAHSRTPTVGIAYAMLRGVALAEALPAVCGVLPAAQPNRGFMQALHRLDALPDSITAARGAAIGAFLATSSVSDSAARAAGAPPR